MLVKISFYDRITQEEKPLRSLTNEDLRKVKDKMLQSLVDICLKK